MRGKAYKTLCDMEAMRITPAYAGKSQSRKAKTDSFRDHPRLCGEKPEAQILKVR